MTSKSNHNQTMNLKVHPNLKNAERPTRGVTYPTESANNPAGETKADFAKRLRRLDSDEMVIRGDFVADDHQGFQLWEGPTGFRADSFLKPTFRQHGSRSRTTKK